MKLFEFDTLRNFILEKSKVYSDRTVYKFYDKSGEMVCISYGKFSEDIEELGTYLINKGYYKRRIAIISENSYDWIRLFFAISFSGNICVPIARDLGQEIIAENLKNVDCSTVFYSKNSKRVIESMIKNNDSMDLDLHSMTEIENYIEEGRNAIRGGDSSFAKKEVMPDDVAAIYFTSGTTGSPKGVVLTQRNLAYNYQSCGERLCDSTKKNLFMLILPLTHALSLSTMCEIFPEGRTAFICKGIKHFFTDMTTVQPDIIAIVPMFMETVYKEVMSELEAKHLQLPYKAICVLSNTLLKAGIDFRRVFFKQILEKVGGNLEVIVTGGAPINQTIVDAFSTWGIGIVSGYGITECAPIVTVNEYKDIVPNSVGAPIRGVDVIIDSPDENGIGEVCVKGPMVMNGYYNRPDETAEVLRDGVFHTGDLGRLDDNGQLFLTGRSKNLIILSNGENISPEYLENKLIKFMIIKETVVYQSDNSIVAEMYPNSSYIGKNNITDVKKSCEDCVNQVNKEIPAYARISKVIVRDTEFPKNSAKKIRRSEVGAN